MGACAPCSHRSKYENIYNDFWSSLKIRSIPQSDWSVIVKSSIDTKNTKKINDATWEKIMKKNLVKEEDTEQSSRLFRKAMALSVEKGGQFLILLSVLFLCAKNSLNTKKEFEDMASFTFHMKDQFNKTEKELLMKKAKLLDIVSFYVNLISLFCVEELSEGMDANPKSQFESHLKSHYSEEVQKKFLNEEIFKEFKDEWVNLDQFFQNQYPILADDKLVREKLSEWYQKNGSVTKI